MTSFAARAVLVGAGATAVMDVAAEAIRRTTGVAPLDSRLVARWLGHMPSGRFAHDSIQEADPVPGEEVLGQVAHYGIGVTFAALLLAVRPDWGRRPTLTPAMAMGLGSSAGPLLVMQPAFGMGVAASKTPAPATARFRTLRTHAIYGLGLYLAGRVTAR